MNTATDRDSADASVDSLTGGPPTADQLRAGQLIRRAQWQRWWLVQGLHVILIITVLLSGWGPWVLWPCAILGSAVSCAATDSRWRWPNRILLAQAVAWLALALIFANPESIGALPVD